MTTINYTIDDALKNEMIELAHYARDKIMIELVSSEMSYYNQRVKHTYLVRFVTDDIDYDSDDSDIDDDSYVCQITISDLTCRINYIDKYNAILFVRYIIDYYMRDKEIVDSQLSNLVNKHVVLCFALITRGLDVAATTYMRNANNEHINFNDFARKKLATIDEQLFDDLLKLYN